MNIPPKYEDLVLKVAELERSEAALLEEASCLKAVLNGMEFKQVDDMVSDGVDACLFLGQESARIIKGIQAERAALREELESIKASVDGYDSPEHAAQVADELGHQCNVLQQRLTVAEQRAGKMEELLREAYEAGDHNIFGTDLDSRIDAALKPAEEGFCYRCLVASIWSVSGTVKTK